MNDRAAHLIAGLADYRSARQRLLELLKLPHSMRDPLAEFSEQLVAALMDGTPAANRVQAEWDVTGSDGARIQVRYVANPSHRWVNEHTVTSAACDRYALVVFENLCPAGVLMFDTARLAEAGAALGKRHADESRRLEVTERNIRAVLADPDRFAVHGITVLAIPAAVSMGDVVPDTGRDWVAETQALLAGLVPDDTPLRELDPMLVGDESEWFIRGWEANLYPLGRCPDRGVRDVCAPDRLDHFTTTAGRHRHLLTRWSVGGWGTSREYVTHLGAYARAVLGYGYRTDGARLSHYGKYRRDLITRKVGEAYEIDVAFPAPNGPEPWLLIEAKASPRDVARWASAIDIGASAAELVRMGFKEVEYLLELKPRHLWLVGPGTVQPAVHVWSVGVHDLTATFTRIPDVPAPAAQAAPAE